MRISYSQYTAFVSNPERYRLHYGLGLTPESDETPTMFNFGRRRGRCFHSLYEGVDRSILTAEYGLDLVERCEEMRLAVPDLGPLDWVERSFEVPILDGKHVIIGRIDHRYLVDGVRRPGDFKSTKGTRTKKETSEYLGGLMSSSQSHFYLKAAEFFGEPSDVFTYHVIFDRKEKHAKPTYLALDVLVGPAQVARTMSMVYAAAETIEFLKKEYGVEKPWPHGSAWPCCGDKFMCGYQELCGRTIPKGAEPDGFTYRWKEQIQNEVGN